MNSIRASLKGTDAEVLSLTGFYVFRVNNFDLFFEEIFRQSADVNEN